MKNFLLETKENTLSYFHAQLMRSQWKQVNCRWILTTSVKERSQLSQVLPRTNFIKIATA
ncbi:hypothetical protein IMY05_005G0050500 [Salix suchowensis]|nr:hypothetical protein IMY05_005G0050500 [Salix suchowensis]